MRGISFLFASTLLYTAGAQMVQSRCPGSRKAVSEKWVPACEMLLESTCGCCEYFVGVRFDQIRLVLGIRLALALVAAHKHCFFGQMQCAFNLRRVLPDARTSARWVGDTYCIDLYSSWILCLPFLQCSLPTCAPETAFGKPVLGA